MDAKQMDKFFQSSVDIEKKLNCKIEKLEKENVELRECVEFYANENNYLYSKEYIVAEYWNNLKNDWDFGRGEIQHNENKTPLVFGGKRARQALTKLKERSENE